MKTPTASLAAKLTTVLAVQAFCGTIGSSLISSRSVASDEREGFFIPFFNFFRRSNLFTKRIDSGTNATFYISRNEWQLFEVFQEPETMCSCTATCLDPASRIDFYMTYDPRVRFNDNWDGWDCEQTLPSNTQKCEVPPPVAGDICWVAVHGDKINRPHQACQISCTIDSPDR
ncbi:hypothetical protein FisN_31Lh003 [Fistulifera solaris]|uniref:Uncharacterized protein n=1 Tax=Fistulifera solaris TaxID=1519565 RepID=A0A1Z5K662_FISSO|nr:hypothetical protein FisN_31Lh003 [Fistulifera solaris]|eukprot:GAX21727.1 hypothetical protein FisN_31Lh003 [Fistulifera solaris]